MSTLIPEDKHQRVLDNCVDVPEEPPSFPMPLEKVGISGKTLWVSLSENKGGRIPFNAKILVNLDANRRGIHMSRIEQAVTQLHDREFRSLPEYGRELASQIIDKQKAQRISLELTGRMPFVQKAAISSLHSIDTFEASFRLLLAKKDAKETLQTEIGAGMHHLTACPCTLFYNKVLFGRSDDPWPQATHSQRSITSIRVSPPDNRQLPDYHELLHILTGALHISQDLLKRPDETELVLKAHCRPQFAEDAVREVAWAAGENFKDTLPPETKIHVHTLSLESIHIHDVECSLETTLGDIATVQQKIKQE